ncbi:serine hydrolase [Vibrio sp. SCSIO 43136]|nr:serine hydrolase [Vibrio sp. SCSIO 43136]
MNQGRTLLGKNKTLLALACALSLSANVHAVSYYEPNPQMDANLERYGISVENWEFNANQRFTMADSHLNHYHAVVPTKEVMPLTFVGGMDISQIKRPDVIPGKEISLYNVMRDRASIQSYVILNKQGQIIAEDYWSNTDKDTKHHLMSAHKSFSSMLFAIAEQEGFLKRTDKAGQWIPEFEGTPWAEIELQHYADMTAGIDQMYFTREGYHNWGMPDGVTSWDSAMSTVVGYNGLVEKDGKLRPPADALGDISSFGEYLRAFALKAKPAWEPGVAYQYRDLNTEIIARAFENATEMNLAEIFEKYLWTKGGFQQSMTLYVNQDKESLASGSMNTTARDFAIGSYLMANDGKNWKGEQVIPLSYIQEIKYGDDLVKAAWPKVSYEYMLAPQAFYKNQWRTITHPESGRTLSMMIGVNGQWSAFDHETGASIATFGAMREHTGLRYVQLYLFDILFPLFDEIAKKQS